MEKKKKSDKISFRETMSLNIRGYRLWLTKYPMMFVSTAAHTLVDSLSPYVEIYLTARIIDEIAGARDAATLMQLVLTTLITVAALSMINAILLRWKNYQNAGQWYKRSEFYAQKLLSMDFCSVDDHHTHDLHSQIVQNDRFTGYGFAKLQSSFETLLQALLTVMGAIALTVTLFTLQVPETAGQITVLNNPLLVIAVIAMMLGVTFISPTLLNKANSYWVKYAESAKMYNRVFSFFGFLGYDRSRALDIRMYRQDIFCNHALETNDLSQSTIAKYLRGPAGGLYASSSAASHIFTGIIYIFVCLKSWGGAFGVGSVTQYIRAITALSTGVFSLITYFGGLRHNAAFLRTTFEFLDISNTMYQGSLTTEKRSDRKYEIEFCNVSFKYPSSDDYALRNVSLKFEVGQRLAVVGQNGSGKTTFIKLLCRLYDPTEGIILLNGIDIRKYDYLQYMSIFSVVFQDFRLLSFSLGQNIAAAAEYDGGKAKDCLVKVGFGERLQTMPKGLDTCLYKNFEEDGVEISGGEAQKIALARALYKNAPFVILDEPTAALDPVAEFEMYSKMNEIVGDKTAVFISHRLSSCRFCDDIAVFHEGELIQRGSHNALIAVKNGKYYELWNAQAQYYNEKAV